MFYRSPIPTTAPLYFLPNYRAVLGSGSLSVSSGDFSFPITNFGSCTYTNINYMKAVTHKATATWSDCSASGVSAMTSNRWETGSVSNVRGQPVSWTVVTNNTDKTAARVDSVTPPSAEGTVSGLTVSLSSATTLYLLLKHD